MAVMSKLLDAANELDRFVKGDRSAVAVYLPGKDKRMTRYVVHSFDELIELNGRLGLVPPPPIPSQTDPLGEK